MIDHKRQLIFIHPPKCAGTSVEKAFGWEPNGQIHWSANQYREHFPEQWKKYFKFTIIRNPFERVVSWHFHERRNSPLVERRAALEEYQLRVREIAKNRRGGVFSPGELKFLLGPNKLPSRDLLCFLFIQQLKSDGFIPRHKLTAMLGLVSEFDVVMRYEDLESDWFALMGQLNLKIELPRINIAPDRPSYRKLLDSKLRNLVEKIFAEDLKEFDYHW